MKRIVFLAICVLSGVAGSGSAGAFEGWSPMPSPLPVTHAVAVAPDSFMVLLFVLGAAVLAILVGAAMGLRQQATRSAQAEAERQSLLRWVGVLLPFAVLLLIEIADESRSPYRAAFDAAEGASHHVRVVVTAWHPAPTPALPLRPPQVRQ